MKQLVVVVKVSIAKVKLWILKCLVSQMPKWRMPGGQGIGNLAGKIAHTEFCPEFGNLGHGGIGNFPFLAALAIRDALHKELDRAIAGFDGAHGIPVRG